MLKFPRDESRGEESAFFRPMQWLLWSGAELSGTAHRPIHDPVERCPAYV